jgi:hypothetical protein
MRNLLISAKYPDKVRRRTLASSLRILLISTAFLIFGINSVDAQTPPCPSSGSSTTFSFAPNSESDSTTRTINLAPCETIEIRETHDMGGNGERGTNLRVSYLNSSGQEIYSQGLFGFYSSPAPYNSIPLQDSYDEPFPWVGVASPIVLPAILKIESSWPYGQGGVGPPEYNFTIIRTPRPGYNVGGTSIAGALLVSSLPTTYNGSFRQGAAADCQAGCVGSPPQSPPDPGQYFKLHLCAGQVIYLHGTAVENTERGGRFTAELYDSAGQYLLPLVNSDVHGSVTFSSNPYTNSNTTDADFYIRVLSSYYAIEDFNLVIDSYVPYGSPKPIAPDATGTGVSVSSEEYHLPASNDDSVLTNRMTELWAKVYWPTGLGGGPYPLVMFLHGNHNTCGRALTSPRVDDDNHYTFFGTCEGPPFLITGTLSGARNDSAGWFGMKITTGATPLIVRQLGRIFITGNSGTHTLRIVRASDNAVMGSVAISMAGGSANQMKYQALGSPVTLNANTSYYIVSEEFVGGDQWYDSTSTITGSGAVVVDGSASSPNGTSWTVGGTQGHSFGLVDFVYDFTTGPGRTVVQNQLGYEYLATQLASRGYIVASINANRGVTGTGDDTANYPDDPTHIFSRGRLVLRHLETLKTWSTGPSAFITDKTLGTSRNNTTAWFGMKITVGSQAITVSSLGRIFVTGNNQTHTVKIVRASDSTDVPGGSVAISMTGGTNGTFKYVNLAAPVALSANTSYYIASQETKNKDAWYDSNTTVVTTALATVDGRVTSTNGTSWSTAGAVAGHPYVPVDFKARVTPVLGVDLTSKIDFSNVGLMGHSRGGQGVRAAYNLYRNPSIDPRANPADINWSSRIPGMNIKSIFEIGPTDFELPTSSTGGGSQYLNGDGVVWNVLLPMCDGDVTGLGGVRVLDRSLRLSSESPASQKSSYTVWGANHNFFNTEWQKADPTRSGVANTPGPCIGNGNTPLFTYPTPSGNSSGSPQQQQTALASLLALFRANLGASTTPSFNQNFDPLYDLPSVVTGITRVDRGYTASPHTSVTKVVQDFDQTLGNNYCSTPNVCGSQVTAITVQIPHHDYSDTVIPYSPRQQGALVTWTAGGCDKYFQINAAGSVNLSGYQTLDLRISRQDSPQNPATRTSFYIYLVTPTGLSPPVSLKNYTDLVGPVGGYAYDQGSNSWLADYRPILQSVRIPLADFTGVNLSQVQGIKIVFNDTPTGAVYVANVRATY